MKNTQFFKKKRKEQKANKKEHNKQKYQDVALKTYHIDNYIKQKWSTPEFLNPDATNNQGWKILSWGFPGGASGKEPACQCRRHEIQV